MPIPTSMLMLMPIFPDGPGKLQQAIQVKSIRYRKIKSEHYSQALKYYLHFISPKLKNRSRRLRIALRFQIILMATDLFLVIHDGLFRLLTFCTCCTKKCYVLHKILWKNLSHRSYVARQNYVSNKKYVVTTKKNNLCDTQKRDQC